MTERCCVSEDGWEGKWSALLLAIPFFLVTLVNHWVVPWFLAGAILVCYCIFFGIQVRRSYIVQGGLLIGLVFVFAFKFVVFDLLKVSQESIAGFRSNLVVYCFLVVLYVLLRSVFDFFSMFVIFRALRCVFWVHVFIFLIQFFLYWIGAGFIDFVQPFTGESSRYVGFDQSLGVFGAFRATGFFSEPSNYSGVIFILLAIIKIEDNFKLDSALAFGVGTIFMSFSTAGVIIAGVFLVVVLLRENQFSVSRVMLLGACALAAVYNYEVLIELFLSQERKYEVTSGSRTGLLDFAMARDGLAFLMGYGPFGVEGELLYGAIDTAGKRVVASLNDSGMLVFLLINFGLLGMVFYGFLLYKNTVGLISLFVFVLATLTKISLFYPLWLIYFVLMARMKRG